MYSDQVWTTVMSPIGWRTSKQLEGATGMNLHTSCIKCRLKFGCLPKIDWNKASLCWNPDDRFLQSVKKKKK